MKIFRVIAIIWSVLG